MPLLANRSLKTAALLGAAAGARSMSAPAVLSRALKRRGRAGMPGAGRRFSGGGATIALSMMALGELVVDVLPKTSDRNAPLPLLGRALSGGLVGAAAAAALGEERVPAALVGALAALISAELTFHARKTIRERTGLPNALLGVLEDALVLGVAEGAVRPLRKRR